MKGIIYVILSAICFGIMPILSKLAYAEGANVYTVLFYRFIMASIILLIYIMKNKICLKLSKSQAMLIGVLGLVGYAGTALSLFIAYNYISVGIATMILYTYPVIVTLFSLFIYKEKVNMVKLISIIITMIGMIILIGMGGNASLNVKGALLALLSALFYSFYVLASSHSKIKEVSSFVVALYVSMLSAVTIFIVGSFNGEISFAISGLSFVYILLLAIISTVIALMAFLQGVKIVGPSKASILSTVEPVVSIVLGFIILKQGISYNQIIGSILIISAVLMIIKNSSSSRKNTSS